jgi:hypothetical protein
MDSCGRRNAQTTKLRITQLGSKLSGSRTREREHPSPHAWITAGQLLQERNACEALAGTGACQHAAMARVIVIYVRLLLVRE